MKEFKMRAFGGIAGLAIVGLMSIGCSSSSDNKTGTAGTTGHAGTTGSAGTTGAAGTTGSAGTTGAGGTGTGTNCVGGLTSAPAMALITDFSDTTAGTGSTAFTYGGGTAGRVQGGATTFHNPASPAGTLTVTGGAATFMATVSAGGGATAGADQYPYNGFVLYINGPGCTDAHTYTGVSFKISGDIGTCGLVFSIGDSAHTDSAADADRGAGTSGVYAQQYVVSSVSSTAATIMVPFNSPSFTNGNPATPPDPTKITGVQWQLGQSNTATATCTGSITIDDVMFY